EEVDNRFYARLVEETRVVAIASRSLLESNPALGDPQSIARIPILLHREMPNAFNAWKTAAGYPDLEPANISYFDAGQLILDAAAEGLGIAFMLENHLASSSDDRLVRVFGESAESPYAYWFACPPAALGRRGVKVFHDWLFDHFTSGEMP